MICPDYSLLANVCLKYVMTTDDPAVEMKKI